MKRIDELGISPLPWVIEKDCGCWIKSHVMTIAHAWKGCEEYPIPAEANANILVASPDMYKTEYDLVDVIERLMNGWAGTCDTPTHDEVVAALEAAKSALAKAAGEEVSHG